MNKKELIELNVSARELLRSGQFEELRKLGESKGISEIQLLILYWVKI